MITFDDLFRDEDIRLLIERADESLLALGYTEHSLAHVTLVAKRAGDILTRLGYSEHDAELARIAGFLHDMGNLANRVEHSQSGAIMAFSLLSERGMPIADVATVVAAIGNHDEGTGVPVNPIAAALILADKSDVRRSRVRNPQPTEEDIHDRVNFSVTAGDLVLDTDNKTVSLILCVDTAVSSVMDYFEIFLDRMKLCRTAAETLGLTFSLSVNGHILL